MKRVLSHHDPRNDGERGRSVRASNHEVLGLSAVEEGIERSEHTVERWLIAERVSQD